MKKIAFTFLIITLFAFVQNIYAQAPASQNVSAPQKCALVIGNGAYKDLTKLTNPVNDATDILSVVSG